MKSSSYKVLLPVACFLAISFNALGSNKISAIEIINNPRQSLKVKISSLSPTRIGFGGYSISEVIGDENKYKIIADSSGQNVFITPKAEAGTIIPLTIITSNNMVQDLLLEVMGDEPMPQSILITVPKKIEGEKEGEIVRDTRSKVDKAQSALMLKAMINDENRGGKYYVTATPRRLANTPLPSLKILQYKTYRFGDLTGASLLVTNSAKEMVYLTEEMISSLFKNVELVALNDGLLAKGADTKAFVVTKKGSLR
jgi:hypothetical protein